MNKTNIEIAKEIIVGYFESKVNKDQLNSKQSHLLLDYITKIENIRKEATEYIKQFEYYIPEDNVGELLNILNGKDNEK